MPSNYIIVFTPLSFLIFVCVLEKMNTFYNMSNCTQKDTEILVVDDDDNDRGAILPGFRFYPTDEELVGFYLRKKVDEKSISIELIKQIDIYKFDPWDLPNTNSVGEKEGYFFCKRGRKYRNSIRPNRVTGSGFWKATGIDKPVYSKCDGRGGDCIGLKKTLVYYRGNAGKSTKTDWMMHEFRLPANPMCSLQEAEVWTLCKIFKRNLTNRKGTSDWKELSTKRNQTNRISKATTTTSTCNSTSIMDYTFSNTGECYVSFCTPLLQQDHDDKRCVILDRDIISTTERGRATTNQWSSSINAAHQSPPSLASPSSSNIGNNPCEDNNIDLFPYGEIDADDLRSVMEFACSHPELAI